MFGTAKRLLRGINNFRRKLFSAFGSMAGGIKGGEGRFFSCADIGLGPAGEKLALKFLKKKGYRLICANFNVAGQGEIDLICADGQSIVFVEVKTRSSEGFIEAEKVITFAKRQRMKKAANKFVIVNKLQNRPLRFDVIIVIVGESKKIRHYVNAFR